MLDNEPPTVPVTQADWDLASAIVDHIGERISQQFPDAAVYSGGIRSDSPLPAMLAAHRIASTPASEDAGRLREVSEAWLDFKRGFLAGRGAWPTLSIDAMQRLNRFLPPSLPPRSLAMTDEPMTRPVVPGELVELVAQERRRCAAIARSVDLFEGDRLKNSDPRETIAAAIESTDRQGAGEVQYEAGRRAGIEAAAKVADSPGFIEARDTDWDAGVNYAKRYIATAIRALRPEHLVARAAMHGEAGLDMSAEQSAKRGRGESC